jgi:uncharacterized protein
LTVERPNTGDAASIFSEAHHGVESLGAKTHGQMIDMTHIKCGTCGSLVPMAVMLITVSSCDSNSPQSTIQANVFPCDKAKSTLGSLICSDPQLAQMDSGYSDYYHKALDDSSDKESFEKSEASQLQQRDQCLDRACLIAWYRDRILDLAGPRVNPPPITSVTPPLPLPPIETRFVQIMSEAQKKSQTSENDMQIGGVKNARDKLICSLITTREVNNWIGAVKSISANSDGKGIIEVELAQDVSVTTWNNAFSDTRFKTLIDPNEQLFQQASILKVGQQVRFSGKFFPSDTDGECLAEGSVTLRGKVLEPELIFKFAKIAAAT